MITILQIQLVIYCTYATGFFSILSKLFYSVSAQIIVSDYCVFYVHEKTSIISKFHHELPLIS